jgi:hypothetical protein
LVVRLLEENAALREENAALREEIARLKGLKGRPDIKPSGMEKGTGPKAKRGRRGRRGVKRVAIDEDRIVPVEVPSGSRFKGYEDFVVQDLVIRSHGIRYRRERWVTPAGETVVAPLPEGIAGHFGPQLQRFVLMQYHQGQVTVTRLVEMLQALGVDISKRQVMRLLIAGREDFQAEARDVLRAGLAGAAWITVDDTGARHKAANGVCTQIGNDRFAWFATTGSKSRLNFLELLHTGYDDYVINEEALAYICERGRAGPLIPLLGAHEDKHFADSAAWHAHLERLGLTKLKRALDPVCIATEAALWGSITAHGLIADTVILSDGAPQFNVARHGLCWVHTERLVHTLDAFTAKNRAAKEQIQDLIWRFYASLKDYCRDPTLQRKAALEARFDHIFARRTGFATLDSLLKRLHAKKDQLLVVLDRPEAPLHTNGSENDLRCQVTKRKISGGTRSDRGRECRDAFLALMKTCAKNNISFWHYLGDRLSAPGAPTVPRLPDLVHQIPASA